MLHLEAMAATCKDCNRQQQVMRILPSMTINALENIKALGNIRKKIMVILRIKAMILVITMRKVALKIMIALKTKAMILVLTTIRTAPKITMISRIMTMVPVLTEGKMVCIMDGKKSNIQATITMTMIMAMLHPYSPEILLARHIGICPKKKIIGTARWGFHQPCTALRVKRLLNLGMSITMIAWNKIVFMFMNTKALEAVSRVVA
mmetsp:Transcript_5545/g.10044  ORF Transcript_5545/g.10044 Transcript_5545/m.10044 type:complete len:206 (+) Transcript_5545:507-1124(+)